jgi:aminoglycoside/choline kinase family phosphotransferase
MEYNQLISDFYKKYSGNAPSKIIPLPKSGSERKYFRIVDAGKTVIGVHNTNIDENEAFIGFSKHFVDKKLPVPEIYEYFPDDCVYFIQDLGDTSLFSLLRTKNSADSFNDDSIKIYKKILDKLIQFQTKGIEGLNLDLCYPHRSFDRQSMMWYMNYFKYMFLKLIKVSFNEKRLENDFLALSDHLLEAGQSYFLYRDFQSANVMIMDGEPWFIDYQGGRRGALQYDVASLLFDAKAYIPMDICGKLVDYYLEKLSVYNRDEGEKFRKYYSGFSIIRLMQALGAFGYRGLYENKPTFSESIVPAVRILIHIIESGSLPIDLPELFLTIKSVPDLEIYGNLSKKNRISG